jgi:hypothetical protein
MHRRDEAAITQVNDPGASFHLIRVLLHPIGLLLHRVGFLFHRWEDAAAAQARWGRWHRKWRSGKGCARRYSSAPSPTRLPPNWVMCLGLAVRTISAWLSIRGETHDVSRRR